MKDLSEELLNNAKAYLSKNLTLLNGFNRIEAEVIVERVMQQNAMDFIERNY